MCIILYVQIIGRNRKFEEKTKSSSEKRLFLSFAQDRFGIFIHWGTRAALPHRPIPAENPIIIFSLDNGPHPEGGADPDFFNSNAPRKLVHMNIHSERDYFELYNIEEDPSETHYLIQEYPDKVEELKGIMTEAHVHDPYFPVLKGEDIQDSNRG